MDYTKPFLSSYPYSIVTPPTNLPITLADVKEHLRLDPSDTSQDDYLTLLIYAAAGYCEKYTRRTLLNTTFRTFRNLFMPTIELHRCPFVSLSSFEYSVSSSFTAVDSSLYYTTVDNFFSKIILKNNVEYPDDGDEILQMIKIEFVAGYGTESTNIPIDLYLAILNHIAALYENRGDCDSASVSKSLPNASKMIYDSYRIIDIV